MFLALWLSKESLCNPKRVAKLLVLMDRMCALSVARACGGDVECGAASNVAVTSKVVLSRVWRKRRV